MSFREYASHDGLGLAELVEEAIARIEKHSPILNAVIHKTYEAARKAAGDPPAAGQEGIFQGVPLDRPKAPDLGLIASPQPRRRMNPKSVSMEASR